MNSKFSQRWFWLFAIFLFIYIGLGINNELIYLQAHSIPDSLLEDFRIYWNAFLRVSQGIDPYSGIANPGAVYRYPLPALLFVSYLSLIPIESLRTAFYLTLNLGLLAFIVYAIGHKYGYRLKQIWWWFPLAFGFGPFFETLHLGQINLITMLGGCCLFVFADSFPLISGLGLMTGAVTKVTPVTFLGYLAVTRRIRALIWGLVILAGAFGLAGVLWGWNMVGAGFLMLVSTTQSIFEGINSQSLVSLLIDHGLIQDAAWLQFQTLLTVYIGIALIVSGVLAWRAKSVEPFFIVTSIGIVIAPNNMWYHHYVFFLLPGLVWLAWADFQPGIVLWVLTGLTITQLDRWYLTQGLLVHFFAHLSIAGIIAWQFKTEWKTQRVKTLVAVAGLSASMILILLLPVRNAINANNDLVQARSWLTTHLPNGARIIFEGVVPFVDASQFTTSSVADISAHPTSWYAQNGYQYIVSSYGTYGHFYDFFKHVPSETYDAYYAAFSLVNQFVADGYDIRVYQTNAVIPTHPMQARLGWQGFWLEVMGYDYNSPSNITFYIHTLETRRESLFLTTRLLDRADREITQSTQPLFTDLATDGHWPDGITRATVSLGSMVVPPGLYRLEFYIESKTLGRLPFLDDSVKTIADQLYTAPIKIPVPSPNAAELASAQSNIQFGNTIKLLGYTMTRHADGASQVAQLTVYWQSIIKSDKEYIVFAHLLDANGNVQAQIDTLPRDGAYPTSIWDAGEIVRDDYTLNLPRDLAPDDYRIELGMYEYLSLTRLDVTSASGEMLGDRLLLDDVIKVTP